MSKISDGKSVQSPCISVCDLDESNICQGCYRSDREIREWSKYTDQQKLEVLKTSAQRFAASGKNILN